ncbi:MAG: hypothetical protein H0U82_08470 [Actinobacteria bacterium]|nr:hypothetical protein [Actinomycetota bacterium]
MALLWTFLLASAAILTVGAVVLSSVLSSSLREQALADSARDVSVYTDAVLAPMLVRGRRARVAKSTRRRLVASVRRHGDVTGASIWSRKGRLVVSTLSRRKAARAAKEVSAVLRSRKPYAEVTQVPTRPGGSQRTQRAVVVWSPLLPKKAGR